MIVTNKKIITLESWPSGSQIELISKTDDGLVSNVVLTLPAGTVTVVLSAEMLAEAEEALTAVKDALKEAATAVVATSPA
jgi:hypothetical protein